MLRIKFNNYYLLAFYAIEHYVLNFIIPNIIFGPFHYWLFIYLSLHLQESHKEGIWEDEFLFAEGEFDVDKLFILVDFYNGSLAEFLVNDSTVNTNCF